MADNRHYWEKKKERAKIAKQWTTRMEEQHLDLIEKCSAETIIYDDNNGKNRYFHSNKKYSEYIEISTQDTVSAILHYAGRGDKVAALNFASYKQPGGMFLKGSSAQEECLCHESFLFNVLQRKEDEYYKPNRNNLNRALYTNRALYSPDIHFYRREGNVDENRFEEITCDIITCAAPNYTTAARYNQINRETNSKVLRLRIQFILDIAASNKIDTLILGAWGCGVFGQKPEDVASIFKELLPFYPFKNVIFAIPVLNNSEKNYQVFSNIFGQPVNYNCYSLSL